MKRNFSKEEDNDNSSDFHEDSEEEEENEQEENSTKKRKKNSSSTITTIVSTCLNEMKIMKQLLQQVGKEFIEIPIKERKNLVNNLLQFGKELNSFIDTCANTEFIIEQNNLQSSSISFILNCNEVITKEIWAEIFSFLLFKDFIIISRVCKLWFEASKIPNALSHLDINYLNKTTINPSIFEVINKYFLNRTEFIKYASGINNIFINYCLEKEIKFINCKIKENNVKSGVFFKVKPNNILVASTLNENYNLDECETFHCNVLASLKNEIYLSNVKNLILNDICENIRFIKIGEQYLQSVKICKNCLNNNPLKELLTNFNPELLLKFDTIKELTCEDSNDLELLENNNNEIKKVKVKKISSLTFLKYIETTTEKLSISSINYNIKLDLLTFKSLNTLVITQGIVKTLHLESLPYLTNLTIKYTKKEIKRKLFKFNSKILTNLKLTKYNSIDINCPNLKKLKISNSGTCQMESLSIISTKLEQLILNGNKVGTISIVGPCLIRKGCFLKECESVAKLECPFLLELSTNKCIFENNFLANYIIYKLQKLTIDANSKDILSLFTMKLNLRILKIKNWKIFSTENIIDENMITNISRITTLKIEHCSENVLTFILSLFSKSNHLISLDINLSNNNNNNNNDSKNNNNKNNKNKLSTAIVNTFEKNTTTWTALTFLKLHFETKENFKPLFDNLSKIKTLNYLFLNAIGDTFDKYNMAKCNIPKNILNLTLNGFLNICGGDNIINLCTDGKSVFSKKKREKVKCFIDLSEFRESLVDKNLFPNLKYCKMITFGFVLITMVFFIVMNNQYLTSKTNNNLNSIVNNPTSRKLLQTTTITTEFTTKFTTIFGVYLRDDEIEYIKSKKITMISLQTNQFP
ncbi:hypothetical protein ABK040_000883 [Willaertia magna]